jgi:glycosyltransferase involved in cell wall biosynthesis
MNNMAIKVSVLIGTYNRASLLSRCLDSIFNQTHKNIEAIVINDISTDDTVIVLENYKKKYGKKLKYITNPVNKGIAYNSNLAFENSEGEYLALLGDDDYWIDEQKIEKQLKVFEISKENLGVIGTWWIEKDKNIEITKAPKEPKNWKSRLLAGGGIICGSTPLIPRKVWIDVGGFDEKMPRGTDSELFRRIVTRGYNATIMKEITTIVDVGHDSARMTPTNSLISLKKTNKANLYLMKKYLGHYMMYPIAFIVRIKYTFTIFFKIIKIKLK